MSDLVERLAVVGFTEYEAKVYVALQGSSPATGYQIAKDSGVPRSMIYEVLDKLTARGAVVIQSFGDMVRYAPVPPDLVLDRMRHEFEDTLDHLTEGFKQLAATPATPGHTWSIEGRDNVLARAREMIERAASEVAVAVGDDDELDALSVWLQRARARKVALTVVSPVPYDLESVPLLVHPQGQQLRHAIGHGLTLIVDGSEALIGETDRSQSAIWTTNSYAVSWALWCLKQEMAGVPSGKPVRKRKR
jgi:HTH-type transcriptional regulator, sugar sensing transcriptional regulator